VEEDSALALMNATTSTVKVRGDEENAEKRLGRRARKRRAWLGSDLEEGAL
jgi:hypothetical protein